MAHISLFGVCYSARREFKAENWTPAAEEKSFSSSPCCRGTLERFISAPRGVFAFVQ
jgi:hypothetical protein